MYGDGMMMRGRNIELKPLPSLKRQCVRSLPRIVEILVSCPSLPTLLSSLVWCGSYSAAVCGFFSTIIYCTLEYWHWMEMTGPRSGCVARLRRTLRPTVDGIDGTVNVKYQ